MISQATNGKPVTESQADHRSAARPAHEPAVHNNTPRNGLRVFVISSVVVIALGAAFTGVTVSRSRQQQSLDAEAAAAAVARPRVTVAVAQAMTSNDERVLPGNSLPLYEASLFARTTGYLKNRHVDIGDRVKEGQLLAEISAPDIDDQLNQARANLDQAKANLLKAKADDDFAQTEAGRYKRLVGSTAVTQEVYESKAKAAKVTAAAVVGMEAAIKVNEAAVQRFADLQAFQKITAPFQGVITARNVDAGDLIPADSPSTTRELFHLMRTDVLRVFINVPQVYASGIHVGQNASVYLRDDPSKPFPGKVTRTSDALDPNTRTLLTEVDVPNPDNVLRPGMYLQVKVVSDQSNAPIMIPAAALATRDGAQRVAVLDDQQRVQYRKVQLGRDYGFQIAVVAGLKPGETIVVHPGDDLAQGTVVEPVPLKE